MYNELLIIISGLFLLNKAKVKMSFYSSSPLILHTTKMDFFRCFKTLTDIMRLEDALYLRSHSLMGGSGRKTVSTRTLFQSALPRRRSYAAFSSSCTTYCNLSTTS